MAGGGLLRLWSQHGLQIMVLCSFALQVFLLARGGTRRRSSSAALRISLWLAYLFADSTAIYALGHLSVGSGRSPAPQEHQLVAFWAPFLLLHLGGPDNITAYALEDNRLWLRHLQTLVVQAVGAAYVVYKYIAIASGGGGSTLLLLAASICMFAAGLVKYGERVWALKCGDINTLDSSSDAMVEQSSTHTGSQYIQIGDDGHGEGDERNNNSHSIQLEECGGHEEGEESSNDSHSTQLEGGSYQQGEESSSDRHSTQLEGGVYYDEERISNDFHPSPISTSLPSPTEMLQGGHRNKQGKDNDEEILLQAHSKFYICKFAFTDADAAGRDYRNIYAPHSKKTCDGIVYLFKLVEMELSLMYDVLYTKAAVIHTWYGFCIHAVSLLATAAASVLFQLSIIRGTPYSSKVDLVISYVLLAGALALEAMSLCRAILSSWTCALLLLGMRNGSNNGWRKWLLDAITSLRRRVQPASRRLWSGSIMQYNLLHLSVSDRSGILCWLAKKVGLESKWNEFRFSSTFSGTNHCCSVEDLKVLVLAELEAMAKNDIAGRLIYSSGTAALKRNKCEDYSWSVDGMDLDKSIIVWHVVTDLFLRIPRDADERINKRLVEATRVLSNYMMYILAVKPEMLPGRARRNVYREACKELDCCWSDCSEAWSPGGEKDEAVSRPRAADMLATWLLSDLYPSLRELQHKGPRQPTDIQGPRDHAEAVYNAIWIYESIRTKHHDKDKWLEMIFQLWVEMMMHVAEHCRRDSHARQLSHGGEFITIMWLIMGHLKHFSVRGLWSRNRDTRSGERVYIGPCIHDSP